MEEKNGRDEWRRLTQVMNPADESRRRIQGMNSGD